MQMMQPRLRFLIFGATCFLLTLLFLSGRKNTSIITTSRSYFASADNLLDDTLNTTLGFEKILAVSLPERTDHRDGFILASALSGIKFEFSDGVHGESVLEKSLPPGEHETLNPGAIGSWRAHLNAIATVVHNNYTSALILEDDVDWDVRLKLLLQDFAVSSHALAQTNGKTNLDFDTLLYHPPPRTSPYGDDWDLLWLGHCGMHLPAAGLVIHSNDSSVPESHHLQSWDSEGGSPLQDYDEHTRIVTRQVRDPVCSLAYAVSQRGARSLLYNLGLRVLNRPYDVMLRSWCEGGADALPQVCLGVLPQLFETHRPRGSMSQESDISDPVVGYRDMPVTPNIRWSVRMNMEKILRGEENYNDQYPDTQ